jgi:pimeloyl-ACP methyl ester carboxylesterase
MPLPLPSTVVRNVVGRAYRALAFADPAAIDPGVVAAFARHHPDRAALGHMLASGRRLIPELRNPFDFTAVSCPVLLVWGDRDRLVFHRGAERVLSEVQGSRLELLEGCGHCPQLERPERVVELLLEDERSLAHAA